MKQVDYSNCKKLEEFQQTTLKELSKLYSYEYVEYLRVMPKYLSECDSYRELGTNQGGSASVALLQNLDYYEFIDKSFGKFQRNKKLFDTHMSNKNLVCVFREMNSLHVQTNIVTDFLLIDSVHKFKHVKKELDLYAPLTNKFIMLHDTNGIPEVYDAVQDFLQKTKKWNEIEHYSIAAGYTVIERIHDNE